MGVGEDGGHKAYEFKQASAGHKFVQMTMALCEHLTSLYHDLACSGLRGGEKVNKIDKHFSRYSIYIFNFEVVVAKKIQESIKSFRAIWNNFDFCHF